MTNRIRRTGSRRIATTVGELVAAAYDCAPGRGGARAAWAAAALASLAARGRVSPRIAVESPTGGAHALAA